jgi:pimeloyl-ACP methyl ester carboxylesterase
LTVSISEDRRPVFQPLRAATEVEELRDIILVGHSFGGGPVSVVANRMRERLKQLVLLDALLLENGQSAFSKLDPTIVARRVKLAQETILFVFDWLKEPSFAQAG